MFPELVSAAVLMSLAFLLILPQDSVDILFFCGNEPKIYGVLQGAAL